MTLPASSKRKSEDDRHHRSVLRMKPASDMLRLPERLSGCSPVPKLVGVQACGSPGSCRRAGGSPPAARTSRSKVNQPEQILKRTPPTCRWLPMVRAIAAAIGTPSMPQRVDSEASAIATTVAVLRCS